MQPHNKNYLSRNKLRKALNEILSSNRKTLIPESNKYNASNMLLHVIDEYLPFTKTPHFEASCAKHVLNPWIDDPTEDNLKVLLISVAIFKSNRDSNAAENENHRSGRYKPHQEEFAASIPGSLFYKSPEWRRLRYIVLSKRGNKCECCGQSPKTGSVIHIDHVKPRSIYPELSLAEDNLQVLCDDCNLGKSNMFEDDWRSQGGIRNG